MPRTSWHHALLAVGALLLAAPLLGAGPAAAREGLVPFPSDDPCRADDTCSVRVGSYNIEARRSFREFRAAVTKYRHKADVAGLQEVAGHVKNSWLKQQYGNGFYRPPNLGQIPVVWDTDELVLLGAREHRLAEGRVIEDKGGGWRYKRDTYAAVVRLLHLDTLQPVSIINVHLINGAMNVGLPDPQRPLTHALYVQQLASLLLAVEQERSDGYTPMVVGDFNISFAADIKKQVPAHPYAAFRAAGMSSIWEGRRLSPHGTHIDSSCPPGVEACGAYLDGVWVDTGLDVVSTRVYRRIVHSDHYPLMGRVALPMRTLLPELEQSAH